MARAIGQTGHYPNDSEAAKEALIREVAAMDWMQVPSREIRERTKLCASTVNVYRQSQIYREAIDFLRSEWEEQMRRLPSTNQLRKKIEHAMALAVENVIRILGADVAANKDRISAARLAAQLDGRFLRGDGEDHDQSGHEVDSLASELLTAIGRHKDVMM